LPNPRYLRSSLETSGGMVTLENVAGQDLGGPRTKVAYASLAQ